MRRRPSRAARRKLARDPIAVYLVSLGCPKNLVDSEVILGRIGESGLAITASPEDAEVIVVNTCGFIQSAKDESLGVILEACSLKKRSRGGKKVVVAGCLAQRCAEEIRTVAPEVDAIVGVAEYQRLGEILRDLVARDTTEPLLRVADPTRPCEADLARFRLTPRHYAYVKIADGCDNRCTFCTIPSIRGRFRSKPLGMILEEVAELASSGTREIILVSQDTTAYGADLEGGPRLPQVLEEVAAVPGVEWIRVLYANPAFLTDELSRALGRIDRVVKYIDVPIQHISDSVLRRMGRRMGGDEIRRALYGLRERVPGIYIRTTLLVGFPGEAASDFEKLQQFVAEFQFERLGVFAYSPEEGTAAARLPDAVPEDVRRNRAEEIMLLQQEIAFRQNRARCGQRAKAIVDEIARSDGKIVLEARTYGEAPEIDPVVLVETESRSEGARRSKSSKLPAPGDIVEIRITGTRDYDLLARFEEGP